MLRAAALAVGVAVAATSPILPAAASTTESACMSWARVAADEAGIPRPILEAIATVESGSMRSGTYGAWPWTVNVNGSGKYFDSRDEALRFLSDVRGSGVESFDVGCFQLNYRWHGRKFASLGQMIEPAENARYAATFLADLHRELGSWERAVMAYHSRTPDKAEQYLLRVRKALSRPVTDTPPPVQAQDTPAPPLTISVRYARLFDRREGSLATGPKVMGSLVPTGALAGGKAFFARSN
jgi:hypothetical protein